MFYSITLKNIFSLIIKYKFHRNSILINLHHIITTQIRHVHFTAFLFIKSWHIYMVEYSFNCYFLTVILFVYSIRVFISVYTMFKLLCKQIYKFPFKNISKLLEHKYVQLNTHTHIYNTYNICTVLS